MNINPDIIFTENRQSRPPLTVGSCKIPDIYFSRKEIATGNVCGHRENFMASTIDSLFKIMKIAGGLFNDKTLSPETKKYVGQIYHFAYLSLAEEGLPSLFSGKPQMIMPVPFQSEDKEKTDEPTSEEIPTAEDLPDTNIPKEQQIMERLEKATDPHEMLSVLFDDGENEPIEEREIPDGLIEGVDFIGMPPTKDMIHIIEDETEDEQLEGVTTNLQEINKNSQWNESSQREFSDDDGFDEFEEEYIEYEEAENEMDKEGTEDAEYNNLNEEDEDETPADDAPQEDTDKNTEEDIDTEEPEGTEEETEDEDIIWEEVPDEGQDDIGNANDENNSPSDNDSDISLFEGADNPPEVQPITEDAQQPLSIEEQAKEMTDEWLKNSDDATANIFEKVKQIIEETSLSEESPKNEPAEQEQTVQELSPLERAFIIPEGVEFPSAMKKKDFTFHYAMVKVLGPDNSTEEAEIIVSPISLKEGAKDIAVWTNCDRGILTDSSGPRKSVLIHLSNVDLIAKGIMKDGELVPSIELTKREAEQGYTLTVEETVDGGKKGHVLLFDEDFYIHIFPTSFPNKKEETNAEYFYYVKRDGETETGETSSGSPYEFDMDGVTSIAAARWTADGVLFAGVMPKGI